MLGVAPARGARPGGSHKQRSTEHDADREQSVVTAQGRDKSSMRRCRLLTLTVAAAACISPCAGWLLAAPCAVPTGARGHGAYDCLTHGAYDCLTGGVRAARPRHWSRSPMPTACARGPAESQAAAAADDDAFCRWAAEQGIRAPKFRIAEFPPGYRGMAATAAIDAGEPLVELPRAATLCVGNRQPNPFPPDFVGAAFWNQQSLHVRLALVLLFERQRAERGDSRLRAWVDMLPASHEDKPCRWSQAELDDLRDPLLAEEIAEQRAAIDAIHEQLVASSTAPAAQSVSLHDFRWAMDTVVSRTFGAQIPAVAAPGLWQTIVAAAKDTRHHGMRLYGILSVLGILIAAIFAIYFVYGLLITLQQRSRHGFAIFGILIAWTGLNYAMVVLFVLGAFSFGHNSLVSPGDQLIIISVAGSALLIYGFIGWALGRVVRKRIND